MNKLDILAENRNALLLAEAIGWLHDYRKCSDEHLKKNAKNPSGNSLSQKELWKKYPALQNATLTFTIADVPSVSIVDLLDEDKSGKKNPLYQYLRRCHYTAHFDKQEPVDGEQSYPGTKISSPFGFERDIPDNLTKKLWDLPWDNLTDYSPEKREKLRKELETLFSQALGDTRRPINEVDLWNWGLLVGSLYKAALAGILLTDTVKEVKELTWRLLSVRVKGLDYILSVSRIPDLLAREQLLKNGLDRVQKLLEVTYPLGSEIYRDENGSVYVVPDLADLLKTTNESGVTLQALITNEFKQGTLKNDITLQIGGEVQPHIELEMKPWWGQDPEWGKKQKSGQVLDDQLPEIQPILSSTPLSQPDPGLIKDFWQGKVADVCTVCGLRPQGPGKKSAARLVCDICEKRRADRSQEWATVSPEKTIWMEEIADVNGRLALLVGQFNLSHWLDGSFLESLFVIAPQDPRNEEKKDIVTKTPSPSRLRRIWETTHHFWQEIENKVLEEVGYEHRRLKIYLDGEPDLGDFHVYELVLGAIDLDVVWVSRQGEEEGYLLSAANLGYTACQLGAKESEYLRPPEAAKYVKNYLEKLFLRERRSPILRDPEPKAGQKKQNLLAGRSVTEITCQENGYAPVMPIMAEPIIFMLLVPADKSLKVVHLIKDKYEKEMGKVRDRLPLKLGIVYAGRRMPVRSVLDAGRAMLASAYPPEIWCVKNNIVGEAQTSTNDEHLLLSLERDKHSFTWHIPLKMGDKTTDDYWYPYFFLEAEGDKNSNCCNVERREAKAKLPLGQEDKKECRVVHAPCLSSGEKIYVWPSIFDFEFLDTNARRFDVYYNEDGRRPRITRPFYLEDIDRLHILWNDYLKYLSKAQCQQIAYNIEATREDWYSQDTKRLSLNDEVFYRFVTDTLAGASWPQNKKWDSIPEEWQEKLIQAGVRGELADLLELYMKVMKE